MHTNGTWEGGRRRIRLCVCVYRVFIQEKNKRFLSQSRDSACFACLKSMTTSLVRVSFSVTSNEEAEKNMRKLEKKKKQQPENSKQFLKIG